MKKRLYALDGSGNSRLTLDLDGVPSKMRIAHDERILLTVDKSPYSVDGEGREVRKTLIESAMLSHPVVSADGNFFSVRSWGLKPSTRA